MVYDKSLATEYIDVLCRQINSLKEEFSTIFIGGGTPSILDIELWKKLFRALKFARLKNTEFTIEANPESLSKRKINLFLKGGCNRISIGVQSLYDCKLDKLTRLHSSAQARNAVNMANQEGFDNINIDLIFGVWREKLNDWREELNEALCLPVKHISVYNLTVEKNSRLYNMIGAEKVNLVDEGIAVEMYESARDCLRKKGFYQYEVSNFSKDGWLCRHNFNYWQNNNYLGLGPSAVSYIDGVREKNVSCVWEYIRRYKKGKSAVVFREKLPFLKRAGEAAALIIRTQKGLNFDIFKRKWGVDFLEFRAQAVDELVKGGLLRYIGNKAGIALTDKGFLFSDTVSSALV